MMMKLKSAQKEIRLPIFSASVIYLTASLLCAMSSSMAWRSSLMQKLR